MIDIVRLILLREREREREGGGSTIFWSEFALPSTAFTNYAYLRTKMRLRYFSMFVNAKIKKKA